MEASTAPPSGDTQTRAKRKERHRATPLYPEVRFYNGTVVEVREKADTNEIVITGTPIVYDTPYTVVDMFGEFEERMAPSVGEDVTARGYDVRLLFNHDYLPLARTAAGTMTLTHTPTALQMTATLDARQQLANDLALAIQRGDVSQMSCGFIVARDEWSTDWDERTIFQFADMLDVSAVTYPCSPTTAIDVAKRMVQSMPIETRARLRRMEVDVRAGKVLSADNQSKLVSALSALHDLASSGGVDPQNLDDSESEHADSSTDMGDTGSAADGSEGGGNIGGPNESVISQDASGLAGRSVDDDPGEPVRKAPDTAAERRDAALSFGDQESAVYQSLLAKLGDGDGDCDIWVNDLGTNWVVYESYLDPMGLWRIAYAIDADNAVTFDGDPERVAIQTSYVPVESDAPRRLPTTNRDDDEASKSSTLRLEAEARRRRRPVLDD